MEVLKIKIPAPGSSTEAARMPHVGELFTDRESQADAFKKSLANFRRQLDSDDESGVARSNVLTFYGMGGIGKSALSQRLEDWVNNKLPRINGWGSIPSTSVAATGRIDLHESAGQMDVLAALLALRAGVATLKPRWPLFDLAFAAYWSSVRPGDPLPTYRGSTQLTRAVVETLGDVLTDIGTLAGVAGSGMGGGLAVRGIRKLISEIGHRKDLRLGIEAYSGFEQFLLRCANEPSPSEAKPSLVCEIAGTLAWELSQISPTPLVAVFIDTTERLALDPRRVSESYLNQLIHKMPNVLFVLTGRDMLRWYDETRVELTHRGPWTWPGLAPGANVEPRQHLVGNLSTADTIRVIERGREQLDLPMSDEVVQELARASAGLPQYLELARQVALSIKDAGDGRTVTGADVTGSLGSLVMRVLEDVPADEQRAIRAASLFRTFDTDLIAAAADVDHGCAERAVTRPMIDRDDEQRFPYRMHDAVREALRSADHQITGGWSDRDWQQASTRAAASAHRLHDEAKTTQDNRAVLDAVGLVITLACEQPTELEPPTDPASTYADWLTRAIVFSPSIPGLHSRVPTVSTTDYGRLVLEFIVAKSVEVPVDERHQLLRKIFDTDHPLRHVAGRHLGYALRTQSCWDQALAVFDELAVLDPDPVNLRQRPYTLSLARRFAEARDAAAAVPDPAAVITRDSEYAHGRPERYFQEIGDKLAMLQSAGRQNEWFELQGILLARQAVFCVALGAGEVDSFLAEAELSSHSVGTRSGLCAAVITQQGTSHERAFLLQRLRAMDQVAAKDNKMTHRYSLAELCDAAVVGDRHRLIELSVQVGAIEDRSRAWIPVECFFESIGLPLPPTPTQWLEPYPTVLNRWTVHFDDYLARHGARREDIAR